MSFVSNRRRNLWIPYVPKIHYGHKGRCLCETKKRRNQLVTTFEVDKVNCRLCLRKMKLMEHIIDKHFDEELFII